MIEELRIGADAITADDERVGRLSYIVFDTEDGTVSGIAIDPGLFESGRLTEPSKWDEPTTIIVPMDYVSQADSDAVHLSCTEAEFKALPPYIEQEYVQPGEDWTPPPGYAIANFLLRLAAPFGGIIPPPMKIRLRKGNSQREIQPDTAVWRVDPHSEIGEVDQVLIDSESNKVQSLVVRRGGIISAHVVLPIRYVTEVLDDVVHVDMSDDEIESLELWDDQGDE